MRARAVQSPARAALHTWISTPTLPLVGILVAAGDVITQQLVEKKGADHDVRRTLRMGAIGIMIGPILRTWYLALERIVPGTATINGFKKMLLDQTLFAPPFIAMFFIASESLAGKTRAEVKQTLQSRYTETLITNYKVWPIAQSLNFTLVPFHYRIGFVQIVALFWNSYLSWMANKPHEEKPSDPDK